MHSGAPRIERAQLAEQGKELVTLGRFEIDTESVLDGEGDLEGFFQDAPTLRGQHQRISTTVGGVRAALHEPETFKVVHQSDHPVGVDVERLTDRSLGLPFAGRQRPQQPEMTRLNTKRGQALGQSVPHLETELGH